MVLTISQQAVSKHRACSTNELMRILTSESPIF